MVHIIATFKIMPLPPPTLSIVNTYILSSKYPISTCHRTNPPIYL